MDRTRGLPGSLSQLRTAIERWRARREKRGPMPPELWRAAVELAAEQGLARVARIAGLDYGSLKRHLAQAACGMPMGGGRSRFVELDAQAFSQACEPTGTVVEFREPDGRHLVIRLSGREPLDIPALLGGWRRS